MNIERERPLCTGVAFVVRDVVEIADFYRRVLHFQLDGDTLRLGNFDLLLRQQHVHGRPIPADSRSNDHCFRHLAIAVRDMASAYKQLLEHRVELISDGPQTLPAWNEEAAGIQALYFRDPDGHALELIHFPPGKGNELWQQPSNALFLGIDHTAIVVSQTEASLRFYRDQLGFRVSGTSYNHGPEQEALSALPSARVRVTTLAGAGPCGVELLEYEAPRDGRRQPADTQIDDLWWATTLIPAFGPRSWSRTYQRDPDGHGVEWL